MPSSPWEQSGGQMRYDKPDCQYNQSCQGAGVFISCNHHDENLTTGSLIQTLESLPFVTRVSSQNNLFPVTKIADWNISLPYKQSLLGISAKYHCWQVVGMPKWFSCVYTSANCLVTVCSTKKHATAVYCHNICCFVKYYFVKLH